MCVINNRMSHVAHVSNLPETLDGQGRLQVAAADTDVLLTKIVDFAGQGQNDISDDGTISKPQVFCYGRDRAGDKMRAVDIDGSGKLNVNVVSTAGDGDLSARTDITNVTTSKNLKCDSNGNLQVGIAANPTVHLRANDGNNGAGSNRLVKCDADGRLECMMLGANDINGGTPHRHLTVDGNGRLLTYPCEHPNSWTNTYLENIRDKLGDATQITRLMANDGDDGAGTDRDVSCDAAGKLRTVSTPNLARGTIGGLTAGTGSQWTTGAFSDAIDMTYHKSLEYHVQGSFSAGHNIFICISNDNATYVRHQAVTTQSIGGTDVFKGSFTSGFRYIKLENGGADISTTTFKQYAVYN